MQAMPDGPDKPLYRASSSQVNSMAIAIFPRALSQWPSTHTKSHHSYRESRQRMSKAESDALNWPKEPAAAHRASQLALVPPFSASEQSDSQASVAKFKTKVDQRSKK